MPVEELNPMAKSGDGTVVNVGVKVRGIPGRQSVMLAGRFSLCWWLAGVHAVGGRGWANHETLSGASSFLSVSPDSRSDTQAATISVVHFSLAKRSGASDILSDQQKASIKSLVVEQCKQLKALGVNYWLDRGTLLGAVRDGEIIEYDTDGDLMMLSEDSDKVWAALENWNTGSGLPEGFKAQKVDFGNTPYLSFSLDGMHSDVGQTAKEGKDMLTDPYGGAHTSTFETELGTMTRQIFTLRRDQVLPTKPCTFVGFQGCQCPNDVGAYLAAEYGQNWYVPLPFDSSTDLAKVAPLIEKIIAFNSPVLTEDMKRDLQAKLKQLEDKRPAVEDRHGSSGGQ